MNENLLKTYIVKSQVERWLKENRSYKYILKRLYEIHLIKITENQLDIYIKNNFKIIKKGNKNEYIRI